MLTSCNDDVDLLYGVVELSIQAHCEYRCLCNWSLRWMEMSRWSEQGSEAPRTYRREVRLAKLAGITVGLSHSSVRWTGGSIVRRLPKAPLSTNPIRSTALDRPRCSRLTLCELNLSHHIMCSNDLSIVVSAE